MNAETLWALGAFLIVATPIGVFLLLRQVWLWYWRINAVVDRLTEIRDALFRLEASAPGLGAGTAPAAPAGGAGGTPWRTEVARTLPRSPQTAGGTNGTNGI
jgi:hypothetical protein